MTPQDPSNPKPPLHNFSLPYNLKWGHQRTLKCIKLTTPNHHHHQSTTAAATTNALHNGNTHDHQIHQKVSSFVEENVNVNVNLNLNLNSNANPNGTNGNGTNDESCSKPWNLRTRRAACKAPLKIEDKRNVFYSNNNNDGGVINSPRRRSLEIDSPRRNSCVVNVNEKLKFSVSLSKNEIEQDFFQIARIRPPRRPKKRPRIVQKYLDSVFPGLWLSEITPDSYKVPDVPES
ncbi:uncharacterized protein LOC126686154 [Mercurialis annua]|uniref:uncharacterized protein LOC126686154 n=1 Tax=Mercurialis annua TaxID=3986 RepID=UPI00215E5522|nr:uncharacterized protein LOC126686154 [Mercurialis annua]